MCDGQNMKLPLLTLLATGLVCFSSSINAQVTARKLTEKVAPKPAPAQPAQRPATQNPQAVVVQPQVDPAKQKAAQEEAQKKAVALLQKRATDGSADAQYDLAMRHLKGDHVEKSPTLAKSWLEKAAATGHERSIKKLAEIKANEPIILPK